MSSWISNQYRWHVLPRFEQARRILANRSVKLSIRGSRNLVDRFVCGKKSAVSIFGDGNRISVGSGAHVGCLTVHMAGNRNTLTIGKSTRLENLSVWFQGDGSECVVGDGSYISGGQFHLVESGTRICIGEGCMVANGVEIRTGDSHGIFDRTSKARINPGKDVLVERNVWLANGVFLLKGANIAEGCIVGSRSIVTKPLDEAYAAYAGNPARKIRSNVVWGWSTDRFPGEAG